MLCKEENCTGCSSCYNICPSHAIAMRTDAEGFLHPQIDEEKCVQCGLCDKSCPSLNPIALNPKPSKAYACWSLNEEIRANSRSGGMFSEIALFILRQQGIVVGAECDEDFYLRHVLVTQESELSGTRISKYWQSDLGTVFTEVKKALQADRKILFVGTPCQVAGLYAFLGKQRNNPNLFTADLICGSVPSPMVLKKYIDYLRDSLKLDPVAINLRDKSLSWEFQQTSILQKNGKKYVLREEKDWFKTGFGKRLYSRPCCKTCQYTSLERVGDVTLGDYWGIGALEPFPHPKKKGVSVLLCNTGQGEILLDEIHKSCFVEERQTNELTHPGLHNPTPDNPKRAQFFDDLDKLPIEQVVAKYFTRPWKQRLRSKIARTLPISISALFIKKPKI